MILLGEPNLDRGPTGLLPTGIGKCKCSKQSQIYKATRLLVIPDFHNKVSVYVKLWAKIKVIIAVSKSSLR